jgi:uncharacterized membrane protein
VVFFATALLTDGLYAKSEFLQWMHFSQWLIAAGLAFGVLASLVLVVEIIAHRAMRTPSAWAHAVCLWASIAAELVNAFVHTRDGWTAVVPAGLIWSFVGTLLALASVAALFALHAGYAAMRGLP